MKERIFFVSMYGPFRLLFLMPFEELSKNIQMIYKYFQTIFSGTFIPINPNMYFNYKIKVFNINESTLNKFLL